MKIFKQIFVFGWLISAFGHANSANAAQMQHLHDGKGVTFWSISGTLEPGDGVKFSELVAGVTKGIVLFDSPGGDLSAGLWIGSVIHTNGLSTAVEPGKVCASACALAWLGGKNRYMSEGSHIGFHAAYRKHDGVPQESGVGNAKVGVYLSELGLPLTAVEFVTTPGPDEIAWLTKNDAIRVGISVIDVEDEKQEAPTPSYAEESIKKYKATAKQAAMNFCKNYKVDGMSFLYSAVPACYERAMRTKTDAAIAYCYMLDLMGHSVDANFQKLYNSSPIEFSELKNVYARLDKALDLINMPISLRRQRTEVWDPLAISALYRALNADAARR